MKRHRLLLVASFYFALLLVTFEAIAGPNVLRAGREKDVLALFAPYHLGANVAGDWKLWSVSIEPQQIVVQLRQPSGREERFTLVHPETASAAAKHSRSFALVVSDSKDQATDLAISQLFEAIDKHDAGGFWEVPKENERDSNQPAPVGPLSPRPVSAMIPFSSLAVDGIVGIFLIWSLATILAVRLLRDAPRWIRIALPAIVLMGALIRFELAPHALLGAWPWSRVWPNVRAVYDGPLLEMVAVKMGQTFFLTDVMGWTNFAYACAMPLVLFSHATYLLRDPRSGIAAAFAIAFLPQHIRFSHCEDAFVPSLVLTSLAFALIHAWLRDSSKIVRGLVLALLPFVLYPGYLLRPLNILFIVVFGAAILLLHPESAPRHRRVIGLGVVVIVGLVAVPSFVSKNESTLEVAAANLGWLGRTFDVLLHPRLFVLTDMRVTPLVLPVLAVAGAICGWRRGEKRLVVFLGGWLMMFVMMHAFVVEPAMQPRYHLHLVVPFLLLGASGVPHYWSRARVGLSVSAVVIAFAPLLHRHWIRDLHYSEMQEYEFVRKARDIVPNECSIVEYVGTDVDATELRFRRIGESLTPNGRGMRYSVIPAFASGVSSQTRPDVDEALRHPPTCSYLYLGLACATDPADDACGALRRRVSGQVVEQVEIPIFLYDRRSAARSPNAGTFVPLTLLRIDGSSGR